MAEEVKKEELGMSILGQKAHDFEAPTTQGTLRLSDYKGSWLVLFFTQQTSPLFAPLSSWLLQEYMTN